MTETEDVGEAAQSTPDERMAKVSKEDGSDASHSRTKDDDLMSQRPKDHDSTR